MSTIDEIKELSKDELLALLLAYSDYVVDFDTDSGEPVCIKEFYEWEYQDGEEEAVCVLL